MQNINNYNFIINSKVINIKTETLYREAKDDLFYYNNVNSAYKKLKEALELTEWHLKSLILFADLNFIKGCIKKALILYKKALSLSPNDPKIISSICNCYFASDNFDEALKYCNKALKSEKIENYALISQLLEIKVNIFLEKKQYKKAYITFLKLQNITDKTSVENSLDLINKKLELQNKLKESNLQIV